jgi:hypothetical protein
VFFEHFRGTEFADREPLFEIIGYEVAYFCSLFFEGGYRDEIVFDGVIVTAD